MNSPQAGNTALPVTFEKSSPAPIPVPDLAVVYGVPASPLDARESLQLLLLSSLGLFNLLLFEALLYIPYLAEVETGLRYFFGIVSVALSLYLFFDCCRALLQVGWRDLQRGMASVENIACAAIFASLFSLIYSLVRDPSMLLDLRVSQVPLGLIFLASLWQFLRSLYIQQTNLSRFFDLGVLVPQARLLRPKTGAPVQESLYPETEGVVPIGELVSSMQLRVGDIVRVSVGDYIPCDGEVLRGVCELTERRFGGHETVRAKSAGQDVLAGSRVIKGSIDVKLTSTTEDARITSFTSALQKRIGEGNEADLKLGMLVTGSYAAIIFFAACSAIYWHQRGAHAGQVALVVSAVLCVAVAVSFLSIIPILRRNIMEGLFLVGALLKSSRVLDRLRSLKAFIIDHWTGHQYKVSVVSDFRIIDKRVDEKALVSAMLSLFGASEDAVDIALSEYLRKQLREPALFEVKDFHHYPGLGVCGNVQGGEFSVGSEGFLIERGVYLQQSEIEPEAPGVRWMYIAVDTDVVAKICIREELLGETPRLFESLRKLGVRCLLCSREHNSNDLDQVGRTLGLELPDISGGLGEREYENKLSDHEPLLLYGDSETAGKLGGEKRVSVSHFDELRWTVDKADITLFSSTSLIVAQVVAAACRFWQFQRLAVASVAVCGAGLLVLAALGVITPVAVLACAVTLCFFGGLVSLYLIPQPHLTSPQ